MKKKILKVGLFIFFMFPSFGAEEGHPDYNANKDEIDKKLDEMQDTVYDGWGDVSGGVGNEVDKLVSKDGLTSFLFNELGKYSSSFSLGHGAIENFGGSDDAKLSYGLGLSLSVSRKAIAHKRIRNNYSVYDYLYIGISPSLVPGWGPASARISGNIGFEFTNIRQISPSDYKGLPRLKKLIAHFKKSSDKEKNKRPSLDVLKSTNEKYKSFMPPSDREIFAKVYLGRVWNPVTQVFRLPLNAKMIDTFDPGEIMAYSLNGGVYVGLGLGSPIPSNLPGLNILRAGVEAGIFFQGRHQVTVMKEPSKNSKDNFVRMKITRLKHGGVRASAGSTHTTNLNKMVNLKGNFVFTTLGGILKFRPYTYEIERSKANIYDAAYRVNLSTKEGREAYNRAAFGDFRKMEKYSHDFRFRSLASNKRPVSRLYTKKEKKQIRRRSRYVQLFLLSLKKNQVLSQTETEEEISGIKKRYLDTEVLTEKTRQLLFAFNKNRSHRFTIHMEPEKYRRTKDRYALTLNIEVKRRNDNTKGSEYVEYVKEVEDSLNRPGMFPLPPKGERGYFKGYLGKTELLYKLKIDRYQIQKLMNYPEKKMWPALIKAFNAEKLGWNTKSGRAKMVAKRIALYGATIPVSLLGYKLKQKDDILIAKMKYDRWKGLREHARQQVFLKDFSLRLGKFFESGDYGPEMIKLLRIVLDGERIPYEGYFKNELITTHGIFKFGKTGKFVDPSKIKIDRAFDYYRPHWRGIPVKNVNATIIGTDYFRLSFFLKEVPKTIFFNLRSKNTLGILTNKSLATVILENKGGRFKKGLNVMQFFIKDRQNDLFPLMDKLKIRKKHAFWASRYRLTVAASDNGLHYGDVDWSDFRTRTVSSKRAIKKFLKYSKNDQELCLGKTATELILLLEKRKFLICPLKAARHSDGTCKEGMTPYDYYSNRPEEENLKKRDDWIIKKCPKLTEEKTIREMTKKQNVCLGKSGHQLIKMIGDKTFYVCDPKSVFKNKKTGLCEFGMIPYTKSLLILSSKEKYGDRSAEDRLRMRNEWIMKYCPLEVGK
jgi:hypothetical protein